MIYALIAGMAILGLVIVWYGRAIVASNHAVEHELRELRLTSRAKINKAKMQSGAKTEEQKLARMGRLTTAKRVVVGGDPESLQHTNLGKSIGVEDEDESA